MRDLQIFIKPPRIACAGRSAYRECFDNQGEGNLRRPANILLAAEVDAVWALVNRKIKQSRNVLQEHFSIVDLETPGDFTLREIRIFHNNRNRSVPVGFRN